ncbi:MAG: hypothetical protein ABSE86_21525 [Bryobacteraceae bacterium]|jgi:hypothetical protein
MVTNSKATSAKEFIKAWAAENNRIGKCDAHLAPTTDHKIIVSAVGLDGWPELPGTNPDQAISSAEREQINEWLKSKFD